MSSQKKSSQESYFQTPTFRPERRRVMTLYQESELNQTILLPPIQLKHNQKAIQQVHQSDSKTIQMQPTLRKHSPHIKIAKGRNGFPEIFRTCQDNKKIAFRQKRFLSVLQLEKVLSLDPIKFNQ